MFILNQAGNTVINTDHVTDIFIDRGLTVKASMADYAEEHQEVVLGEYSQSGTTRHILKSILIAADKGNRKYYMPDKGFIYTPKEERHICVNQATCRYGIGD